MKRIRMVFAELIVFSICISLLISYSWSAEEYNITFEQIEKLKAFFDDPRPLFKDLSHKKILPPGVYDKLTYDVEAMKRVWSEVVGFKAPDVVGKITPEIKPGIYTYQDKEKLPGLKTLMIPLQYDTFFKPGGPPHAGNFPEIEIVPTRQYYYALPIAEATRKQMGKTRQNDKGYLTSESYEAGFPFPRPSGKFKAQQIMYNWEKRYTMWDSTMSLQISKGFKKDLKIDFDSSAKFWLLRLHGRVLLEPYGWYDERARKLEEAKTFNFMNLAPRDLYGNVINFVFYLDPDKIDQLMMYVNVLRRIRKLSGTDVQDQAVGQEITFDDFEGFNRKFSPKRYPWKFELIDEREYLVPACDQDGSIYLSKKGLEYRNIKFERRPIFVVKLTQTDPNYIYGHTILYIDQETFLYHHIENYDQKKRLYRTVASFWSHFEDMGMFTLWQGVLRDYLDLRSDLSLNLVFPAIWINRDHVNLQSLIKGVK
jgi:hypothetical protein